MITNNNCYIEHTGDGVTTSFAFAFVADNSSEIKCKKVDLSGGVADMQSTEYSVTLNGANNSVNTTVALANGWKIRIYRVTPITQEVNFDDGAINNTDIANSMDKITKIAQEQADRISKATLIGPQGLKGDKGDKGDAATITVGTTTTLGAGENATVTNSGDTSAAVFNFGIPKGVDGADTTDEKDSQCEDAAITPKALARVSDYRISSTTYGTDDIVACQYHAELLLKCKTAGTTSSSILDTSGVIADQDEITDGTVVWVAEKIDGKENVINKVTSLSSSSTDTEYPSAKAVYDLIGDIETLLSNI